MSDPVSLEPYHSPPDPLAPPPVNHYCTLSAHSGAITSLLEVIDHRKFGLATGAMIPVVLKVEYGKEPKTLEPTDIPQPAPECSDGSEGEAQAGSAENDEAPDSQSQTSGLVTPEVE